MDVTNYVTNRRGQTTQLIDPINQITNYTYNGFGDLIARKVPSAGPETWDYDEFGRTEKWQQDNEWVKYVYNSHGDLHAEKWGNRLGNSMEELAVERLYDDLGRATRVDSTNLDTPFDPPSGCASSGFVRREFAYESNGRRSEDRVQVGTCAPLVVSSSWSTMNNEYQRDTAYPSAGGNNLLHTQIFDGQGRLHEQEVGWFGVGGTTSLTTAWNGSRMSQRATTFSQNLAPVISDATYDVFGARTQWDTSFDTAPLFNVAIERDVLSRVRSATTQFNAGPMRWEGFAYDVRHHLTIASSAHDIVLPAPSVGTHTNATNASVEAAASILGATATVRTREEAVGATLTISGASEAPLWQATKTNGSPGRDGYHRLQNVVVDGATFPIQHDDRGRIATAPELDLTYDVYNRLVGAQKGPHWEAYLYDGDGLMVGRHTSTGDFEQYAWDGNHMIGAYDGNLSPRWEAIFGEGQDELLAYYDYMNGTDYLPVRDWRNNLVSVFDTSTQNLLGHAEYTPEGRVTTFDNAGSVTCQEEGNHGTVCPMPGRLPFAFNGQWRSSLTGLSYMRNRWYSPRLGQFMSHDPLHYVDSVNLYSFAGFDPINSWDPFGLESWLVIRNTGQPAPFADGLRSSSDNLRVAIVSRELLAFGQAYFNHTYTIVANERGEMIHVEGNPGELHDSDKLSIMARKVGEFNLPDDSPVPGTDRFKDMWKDGIIESVSVTDVKSKGQVNDLLKLRRLYLKPEKWSRYEVYPGDDEDEGNCNSTTNSVLRLLDLKWPKEIDDWEHVGNDKIVKSVDRAKSEPELPAQTTDEVNTRKDLAR
jgi:RHS repeat-associated protein